MRAGGAVTASIREYRDADIDACRGLWNQLTQRHREIYEDPSIGGADPGGQFDQYLHRQDLHGPWVAQLNSEVVGLAGLLVNGVGGEIEPVVVRSDVRSRGIGTGLIRWVHEEARRRGMRYLSIRPVARNAPAIACFYRAGFHLLGHVEMIVDLVPESKRRWQPGIEIHGHAFRF